MEKLKPYAKAIIASLPALATLITALVNSLTEAGVQPPLWLIAVVTALTALGVYEVPNKETNNYKEI